MYNNIAIIYLVVVTLLVVNTIIPTIHTQIAQGMQRELLRQAYIIITSKMDREFINIVDQLQVQHFVEVEELDEDSNKVDIHIQ